MVWPMMVLITGEVFGTRHVGANYMFFDGFSSAAGTLLLSKFVAQEVYDEHITEHHGDDTGMESSFQCIGRAWKVRVCIVLSCVISVIWLLRLAFFSLHLTAFTPDALTYVAITSLSSS